MNIVSLDLEHAHQPGTTVMGIDEAGRGPLAGPVFAAAVSVPLDVADSLLAGPWAAINDSKKLSEKAEEVLRSLNRKLVVTYDETGSIGKRYRRQDEIGTPYCVTIDFQTVEDGTVTIRERDTMEQIRLPIADLEKYLEDKCFM